MHKPSILLLGYGQLNRALAARLNSHCALTAVSRTPQTPEGLRHVAGDLTLAYPTELKGHAFDQVVFCLSPADYTESAYAAIYDHALANVLEALTLAPPGQFFLVSSTSVYSQNGGEWVDEESPAHGNGFAGRQLIAAEARIRQMPFPTTSIRFSGIYGGDRTRLIEQARRGDFDAEGPSGFSNRIHQDDAVGILAHLICLRATGASIAPCYLASDCEPTPLHEVMNWLALQLGSQAKGRQSAMGEARRRAGSKRCANRRTLDSGYRFLYPSFREGYGEMLTRLGYRP